MQIEGKNSPEYFLKINFAEGKCLLLDNNNFVRGKLEKADYPLVSFRFPFMTFKENVISYVHPKFLIKLLYLLNKIKYAPRISDAMRTNEDQIKYKRRGWSNVESSPHLTGIAADLSYFTRADREMILKYNQLIGVHFLEHGRKGNHHIHLQDEELWQSIKDKSISSLSDTLNRKISITNNLLKPYALEYTSKGNREIFFKFYTSELDIIRIEIEDMYGRKAAEITSGVYEPGSHEVSFNINFLPAGIYSAKLFRNNLYYTQKIISKGKY